jgi:hypothetical protein
MKIRLLHSADDCSSCSSKVLLNPDPIKNKFFLPFNLVCSLLIGWGVGEIRIMSGEVFGFANICADVIIYLLFFGMLRLVIFQFQTPIVFRTEKS